MLMINVGLSAPKAGKLIKLFTGKDEIVNDGYSLNDKTISFLNSMCEAGFVRELVSDWGNQETSYCLTNIGKDILRTKTPTP